MAGSLQRPPSQIIPINYKCSISKAKSIIILRKQHLLHTKGSHQKGSSNSHKNQQQLHHQLLKQLKYCQSLSRGKLLFLLPSSSLSLFCYDSCWTTAIELNKKKRYKNLTTPATPTKNYVQHQQHQQQKEQPHRQYQKLPLQKLQILNKTFKSSKFRKYLLNCKKLQQLQLRQRKSLTKNQLQLKPF